MDPSDYHSSFIPLSDSPTSLFPTPSASQVAFDAMREGANIHHNSVFNSVLRSEPIKEFVVAKASFAIKEGLSTPHSVDASNHSAFPSIHDVRAQSNRPQQADLALISTPPSPCSPKTSYLAAAGSPSSQRRMDLMHLSPPLMEKLKADLVLLQKKYGLGSQALTPARLAQQDASTAQADLISSKQAALGTFVSPLRHNNPPSALRTKVPCALLASNSFSPNQLPPSLNTTSAHSSNGSIPRETTAPARKMAPNQLPPHETAAPACEMAAPARETADPACVNGSQMAAPACEMVAPAAPARETVAPACVTAATSFSGRPTANATATDTSTVSVSHARETDLPAAQIGIPLIPMNQSTESSVNDRSNAPLHSSSTVPPIVRGNPGGSAPHGAQIGTVSALMGTVPAQMCSEPNCGNAPMHNSATQGTTHVQGSSWAARLGGSRSTSSTTLSYIPPTVIAGSGLKMGCVALDVCCI